MCDEQRGPEAGAAVGFGRLLSVRLSSKGSIIPSSSFAIIDLSSASISQEEMLQ